MKTIFKKIVLICAVFQLFGCATPAVVQKADPESERKAKAFQVDSNKSKIYFVNGLMTSGFVNPTHSYPSDVIVNEILIGSMNKENVMVIDVAPGSYNFSWMPRSTDPIDQKATQKKMTVNRTCWRSYRFAWGLQYGWRGRLWLARCDGFISRYKCHSRK
jgi:hypothetical protein